MQELTVMAKDRIGLLSDISEVLSNRKVSIRSLAVETLNDKAIVRIYLAKERTLASAKKFLAKAGFSVTHKEVVFPLEEENQEL